MKKKTIVITTVLLLIITGFVVYKTFTKNKTVTTVIENEETDSQILPEVDASVQISVARSTAKSDTVELTISKLDSKYTTIEYEITYDSQGLIKGVNSGSKPLDLTGQTEFKREVYLGTCSRNVCKPDVGVTKASVALEFTDTSGNKSQFSKDFDL